MEDEIKLYQAMIWECDKSPGKRVSVLARNSTEAKEELESSYGKGKVFDVYNKQDANRIR